MKYEKGNTYLIVHTKPLVVRTQASEDGLEILTLPPGFAIHCISYTHDSDNNIWIRIHCGWVKATNGDEILIQ